MGKGPAKKKIREQHQGREGGIKSSRCQHGTRLPPVNPETEASAQPRKGSMARGRPAARSAASHHGSPHPPRRPVGRRPTVMGFRTDLRQPGRRKCPPSGSPKDAGRQTRTPDATLRARISQWKNPVGILLREILQPFVYRLLYFPQSTKHAWVAQQLGITEREAEGPTEPKRPKTPTSFVLAPSVLVLSLAIQRREGAG